MRNALLYIFILYTIIPLSAEDSIKTKSTTVYMGISQDNYYGFSAFGLGYYPMTKKTSFGFYTILRQSTLLGTNNVIRPGGAQLGPGIRFNPLPGLFLTPVLGLVNGSRLSGGPHNVIAEGIAPGCFNTYYGKRIYVDQSFLYYQHTRKEGPKASNYIWYWFTLGYNISKRFMGGAHFEQLFLSHTSNGESGSQYQFLAPFIQANFYKNSYLRFTAGHNFTGGFAGSNFFRVMMVLSFIEK